MPSLAQGEQPSSEAGPEGLPPRAAPLPSVPHVQERTWTEVDLRTGPSGHACSCSATVWTLQSRQHLGAHEGCTPALGEGPGARRPALHPTALDTRCSGSQGMQGLGLILERLLRSSTISGHSPGVWGPVVQAWVPRSVPAC